jgi:hypothetical protein
MIIELRLPHITAAKLEVAAGKRILTVYTTLATEMGSPDWENFSTLRDRLYCLVSPEHKYDEIRLISIQQAEQDERTIRMGALGDPQT